MILRIFSFLIIASMLPGCMSSTPAKELIGTSPSYVQFTMFDGSQRVIEEMRGKPLVLLYWATWCKNSQELLSDINSIAKKRRDVRFIAVNLNMNDEFAIVKEITRKYPYMEYSFSGNGELDLSYSQLKGDGLPFVLVFDQRGRVVGTGRDTDIIERLLKVSVP